MSKKYRVLGPHGGVIGRGTPAAVAKALPRMLAKFKTVKVTPNKAKPQKPKYATSISEQGLEFIARFEGCPLHSDGTLRVYNDAANNATVGIGRLLHRGPYTAADVARYRGKRYKDALAMLREDVGRFEAAVRDLRTNLTQSEFDALVSFAFNCGAGALDGGIKSRLRSGDKRGAMSVLREYDHAGDQTLAGLVRRRAAESRLFLTGRYS